MEDGHSRAACSTASLQRLTMLTDVRLLIQYRWQPLFFARGAAQEHALCDARRTVAGGPLYLSVEFEDELMMATFLLVP